VRQLVFPELDAQYRVVSAGDRNAGRGLTVQNLHCSELARWPGDPGETLAGLRAAMAPEAELILESTPDGVGGCFHEEWLKADEAGMVRHFFPWWLEARYRPRQWTRPVLQKKKAHCGTARTRSKNRLDSEGRYGEFSGSCAAGVAEDEESCSWPAEIQF